MFALFRAKTTKKVFIMLKLLAVVGIIALLALNFFLFLKPQSHIVLEDAVIYDRPYNATKNTIIYHPKCTDIVSIEADLTQKTTNHTGLIFSHPKSNFSDDALRTFVGKIPLNWESDPPQFKRTGEEISKASIDLSITRSNYTFRTTSGNNLTLLPAWGRHGITGYWRNYTTAIFLDDDQCHFPEIGFMLSKDFRDRFMERKQVKYLKKVLISGDSVNNFWHSMLFVDAMCRHKDDPGLYFLISTIKGIPMFVTHFANAFGVSVVDHDQPIVAEEILTSTSGERYSSYHVRDWSCIRDHFATEVVEQDSILFILRRTGKLNRDIPKSIHDKLVRVTSAAIPSLKVVTFDGSETFDEAIKKFQRAKIVVGPHGAAMTNLLFSKEGTQVIEYLTPSFGNRPWLFFCSATIGMEWWPVTLSSYRAESEILQSVAIIKKVANRL